jgi:hypothetical protein
MIRELDKVTSKGSSFYCLTDRVSNLREGGEESYVTCLVLLLLCLSEHPCVCVRHFNLSALSL